MGASDPIQTSWVRKYSALLAMKPQQMDSRFIGKVFQETNVGSGIYLFDRFGEIESQEVTTRFGDTPHNAIDYRRRGMYVRTFDTGRLVDGEDKLRAAIDPTSKIMQAMVAKLYQDMDDVINTAFWADVLEMDEEEVISVSSFPSENVVAVTEQSGAGSGACGLNAEKLRAAQEILQTGEVTGEIYCGVTPKQVRSMMSDPEYTNADYNALQPLMSGRMVDFYGVKFFLSNRILKDSNNYDRIPLFRSDAMRWGWGEGADITGEILKRPDKKGLPNLYAKFNGGCAREHDEGLVEIKCAQTGPTAA